MEIFDGKEIRDQIIKKIADDLASREDKPILAEILVGNDPVSAHYAELKKKMAEKAGITFNIYTFNDDSAEEEIIHCIDYLNNDNEITGIMVQIPLPKNFDRDKIIKSIAPSKDVDGLRFCLGLESDFRPPVVLAILEALKYSGRNLEKSKITVVGKGFLVGNPLVRVLSEKGLSPLVLSNHSLNSTGNDKSFADSMDDICSSDIVISATGKPHLVQPSMLKDDVVLVDAGTAEENGQLVGDIDPESYSKASYYTPVPGGIGPVTVAMLFRNLVSAK